MSGSASDSNFGPTAGTISVESSNQRGQMRSFLQMLCIVLESSPPAELKNLSATCRSLRASFCARIKVIRIISEDASRLCCTNWPQLLMVVSLNEHDLQSKLSAQWEYMLEMDTNTHGAVLVRSRQQLHNSLKDLPSQHCAALSAFADKVRHLEVWVTLRGPLVCCWLTLLSLA